MPGQNRPHATASAVTIASHPGKIRHRSIKNRDWICGAALLVATIFAYQPAWHGAKIWDDNGHITKPELRSISGLGRIWGQIGATQQYYPLVHSVFWLEHRLWGDVTTYYHFVDILLHVFSAFLLMIILRRLRIPGAWLAAGIFALHPVQVESVAWITELKNVLSGVFFLASVFTYLAFDERRAFRSYGLAFVFFILGLLSKSVIAPMPVAMLSVLWWKRGSIQWKKDVLPLLPFIIIGIAFGLFTAFIERTYIGAEGNDFSLSFIDRCLVAGRAVWFYAVTFAWPVHLTFIYPRWDINSGVWWHYLFPIAALAGAVLLWACRRVSRAPATAFFYFVAMLFPALGFFNIFPFRYSFVADHFQYLAAIGPVTVAAAALSKGASILHSKKNLPQWLIPAVLLLSLGSMTFLQSRMYRDVVTLYRTTIQRNPRCWMAYNNLGMVMNDAGQTEAAMGYLRKAIEINPEYPVAYYNMGVGMVNAGRIPEAEDYFNKAIALDPRYAEAWFALGDAFFKSGSRSEAIEAYRNALEIKPTYVDAHNNLGNVLLQSGRVAEAIEQLQLALSINPEYEKAHYNLGVALFRNGQTDAAIAHFRKAVAISPDDADAHCNFGIALLKNNRTAEAIAHFRKAAMLNPDNGECQYNLGVALLKNGMAGEAAEHFKEVVRINPADVMGHGGLGEAYLREGAFGEAIAEFHTCLKYDSLAVPIQSQLAWLLATCVAARERNGQEAVALAARADRLCGGRNARVKEALAAGYAETGRFGEAIRVAREALSIADASSQGAVAGKIREQLLLYQAGHSLHE